MTEIFDIIQALNRLKDRVDYLCLRIDFLCKFPSTVAFEKYVSTDVACKILHVSSRCLFNYRKGKKIPFITFQRRILYCVDDLDKWLKS